MGSIILTVGLNLVVTMGKMNNLVEQQAEIALKKFERSSDLDVKGIECNTFKIEVGLNRFTLSLTKCIESIQAIGIITTVGRYCTDFAYAKIYLREFSQFEILAKSKQALLLADKQV
jgi:hypothetical protein